jgi:hypothetical protein
MHCDRVCVFHGRMGRSTASGVLDIIQSKPLVDQGIETPPGTVDVNASQD